MKGDDLIGELLRAEKRGGKMLSMQLLSEIQKGYPARNVLRLIQSSNDWAASEGAFILAEAGSLAGDLRSDIPELVAHHNMRVRYWAVDVFLFAADASDARLMCTGLRLLGDSDAVVRSYAIRQFTRLPTATLTVIGRSAPAASDDDCANLATALVETNEARILAGLRTANVSVRAASMSAALRANKLQGELLERAKELSDAAIVRIIEQDFGTKSP